MSRSGKLSYLLVAAGLLLAACEPDVQDVRIAAQDFRFDPRAIRLSATSPVRLRIVNEGREMHEFASPVLSDPQLRIRIESPEGLSAGGVRIAPGRSAMITFAPPPGTYLFRCRVRGHAGMTGTLIIE